MTNVNRAAEAAARELAQAKPAGRDVQWAHRILEREASGRDMPPAAVLRMARRALGLPEVPQQ